MHYGAIILRYAIMFDFHAIALTWTANKWIKEV